MSERCDDLQLVRRLDALRDDGAVAARHVENRGLAAQLGQPLELWTGRITHVDLGGGHGNRELREARAETKAPARVVPFDERVVLERREQRRQRALRDTELAAELGEAPLATRRERLQDADRPVDCRHPRGRREGPFGHGNTVHNIER